MTVGPELVGDTWLGTGGRRLRLADLRGRIVLLDFWTLCCVNCHHVLAELREIEQRFADVLTVVGVHSPKFDHEKDPAAVTAAMQRHGISHPVLNDPDMATWQAYEVRAWPTLVLLDAHGQVAASFSGEGHGHAIAARIAALVAAADADQSLRRGPDVFVPLPPAPQVYLQPGKALLLDDEQILISDSGNHGLAVASLEDPHTPLWRVGDGTRGLADGIGGQVRFNEPYGAVRLPADLAADVGYDVVIADTGNHVLRGLRLETREVRTLAGTGAQWMRGDAVAGPAREVPLSTPWDVALVGRTVWIAMAGDHRIWQFDPRSDHVQVLAGTTGEGVVDGPFEQAWFAQPSALVPDGDAVWVVDSETSALRRLADGQVTTVIGSGLFDFGDRDGPASQALLQHPLGAALLGDGSVAIADAYNGAVRRYDPGTAQVSTIARDLAEPSDVVVVNGGSELLVVEAAVGRLTRLPVAEGWQVAGQAKRTERPALDIAAGEVTIEVMFAPPPGQKLDDRFGPSTQLVVDASPAGVLVAGAGPGSDLTRVVRINSDVAAGVLHVAAKGASCDEDTGGPEDFGACHIHQQDWGIPISVTQAGTRTVRLVLAG
jgi:thiol-disulfide isomerase/thioredoxin